MPRVRLIMEPEDEITAAVFEGFEHEGRDPIALYRVLANSPKLLRAYSTLARALRHEAETPRQLRELLILRIAQLTGSEYEWAHHRPMAAKAGLAEQKVLELNRWRTSAVFDPRERAVLRCVDELHDVAVSDGGFRALRAELSESQTVEIMLLAAFYESVARVIQALGLEIEPEYRRFLDLDG